MSGPGTDYVPDPNQLFGSTFFFTYADPNEVHEPEAVKYVNWRFIMRNEMVAEPPTAPPLESFLVGYRLQPR